MSKIDITCSDYIQQPYVIASLFQSALLDDNDVIMESDVVLQDTREPKIMNNGEKHQERRRDIHARITLYDSDHPFSCHFCLELMSYNDTAMMTRVMDYDITTMQVQIRNIRSDMERTGKGKDVKTCNYLTQLPHVLQLEPCFTCVLNLSKQKWEGYSSSEELYDPSFAKRNLHPVTTGVLKVIDPHTMSEKQLDQLLPELKLLFLAIRYQSREYAKQLETLLKTSHVQIGRRLATALSQILNRNLQIPEEGETIEMCESMDVLVQGYKAEGRAEGRMEGVEYQNRIDTIKLLKMNWTLEQISDFVERSIEEVESWAMESSLPYRRS